MTDICANTTKTNINRNFNNKLVVIVSNCISIKWFSGVYFLSHYNTYIYLQGTRDCIITKPRTGTCSQLYSDVKTSLYECSADSLFTCIYFTTLVFGINYPSPPVSFIDQGLLLPKKVRAFINMRPYYK